MEVDAEVVVPHTEEPQTPTAEEIADWKAKAAVSSQNFERLKKAEEEKARLAEELEALKAQSGVVLDDTDVLAKVAKLEETVKKSEEGRKLNEVFEKYPVIADKREEFDS